jgi:hypothetical protein
MGTQYDGSFKPAIFEILTMPTILNQFSKWFYYAFHRLCKPLWT